MSGTSGHDNNLQERPTQTYEGRNYPMEFNIRKLPDRWLKYDPVHRDIPETRLVAFKTPLKASFFNGLPDDHEDRFEVETLLKYAKQGGKTMGLVVDLTNTNRYYESMLWSDNGVQYEKIRCPGHEVHDQEPLFQQFMTVLRNFFRDNADNDKIVGVHCTHGVNRTGYMICRYLITDHGWTTDRAVEEFNRCRRHPIERPPYIAALRDAERLLKCGSGIRGPTRSLVSTSASSAASVVVPKEEPKREESKCEEPVEETTAQSELLECMSSLSVNESSPEPNVEPLVVCPYDRQHVISATEIPRHMAQCRRVHYDQFRSSMRIVICKYDGRHKVPAPEMPLHETFCHARQSHQWVSSAISKPVVSLNATQHG